jgi:ATP-dependent DNA helicase PIF1
LSGDYRGSNCLIPWIELHSLADDLSFILSRRQFPVPLCFAMTINKSQGQSLEIVGVYLQHSAFTHGQLYVALSRVTDVRRLTVLLPEDRTTTENIVYTEVLSDIRREFSVLQLAVTTVVHYKQSKFCIIDKSNLQLQDTYRQLACG